MCLELCQDVVALGDKDAAFRWLRSLLEPGVNLSQSIMGAICVSGRVTITLAGSSFIPFIFWKFVLFFLFWGVKDGRSWRLGV